MKLPRIFLLRVLLPFLLLLSSTVALWATEDVIVVNYTTAQTLYVRFDDTSSTAVNLTEGSTLKLGRYAVTDTSLISASLTAGLYHPRVFAGTAGAQSSGDSLVAVLPSFKWSGTRLITTEEIAAAKLARYNNVLFVGSGQHYTTIPSAKTDAASGDLIVVCPGTYTVTDEIGKTGVDYYFAHGANINININTSTATALFDTTDTSADGTGNVYGQGTFTVTHASHPYVVNLVAASAPNMVFEAESVVSSGGSLFFGGTASWFSVKARNLSSSTTPMCMDFIGDISIEAETASSGSGLLADTMAKLRTKFGYFTTSNVNLTSGVTFLKLDGYYEFTNASANGISAGTTAFLGNGGVVVPAGRPALSGSANIFVSDSFSYNTANITATNLVLTRSASIMSRLPSALSGNGNIKSDIEEIATSTADATAWKTFIDNLGQLRYRLGLDGSTSAPTTNKPRLEQYYVHP
jgi:hypothetical protein